MNTVALMVSAYPKPFYVMKWTTVPMVLMRPTAQNQVVQQTNLDAKETIDACPVGNVATVNVSAQTALMKSDVVSVFHVFLI